MIEREGGGFGSFGGSLAAFPLFEVCQFLMIARRTGTLTVRADDRKGMLAFDNGQIVSVFDDRMAEGDDAFHRVMEWKDGEFTFVPGPVVRPSVSRITLTTDGLLIEAARRLDETGGDELSGDREPTLGAMLYAARERGGERLLLRAGHPPLLRRGGEVVAMTRAPIGARTLDRDVPRLFDAPPGRDRGDAERVSGEGRHEEFGPLRYELRRDPDGTTAEITLLLPEAPDIDAFGLEAAATDRLLGMPGGLVLIGSPARGGKSALAAALGARAAAHHRRHVLLLEESPRYRPPVPAGALEVRPLSDADATDFLSRLWHRKVDVLVVDALRTETGATAAWSAALGGKLVFAAVEASEASEAVNRLGLLLGLRTEVVPAWTGLVAGTLIVVPAGAAGDEPRFQVRLAVRPERLSGEIARPPGVRAPRAA